jgi:minor extracellular serine protease Vpr
LAGVSVVVNGMPAALFSVAFANGEDQISFQVPWETPIGPGAVEVDVFDHGFQTASISADSFTEDPGIFVYNGSYAVATATNGSLIGPDNPAILGDALVLYTTGLGPVTLDLPDGVRAPFDRLAYTIDTLDVFVFNERCEVLFFGLAPGFVGLYQINFRLRSDLPRGNLDIQIQSPYADSRVATLPVD